MTSLLPDIHINSQNISFNTFNPFSYCAVVPALSSDPHLINCLQALFTQSVFSDYQILLVLSHFLMSRDYRLYHSLRQFAKRYPLIKFDFYLFSNRLNGSVARNFGFSKCLSRYAGLCDSDDIWKQSKVHDELLLLKNCMHPNSILGSPFEFNASNKISFVKILKSYAVHRRRDFPHTSTWVIPRSIFSNILFDESLERFQDLDYILRLSSSNCTLIDLGVNQVTFNRCMTQNKIKLQSFATVYKFAFNNLINYPHLFCLFIAVYYFYPRLRYFYLAP